MNEDRFSTFLDEPNNLAFGDLNEDFVNETDYNAFDANNDETFGAPLLCGPDGDLEEYAAQTACLRLDDFDAPGCSDAPDASQLPLPDFSSSLPKFNDIFHSYGLNDAYSIWDGPIQESQSQQTWNAPELSEPCKAEQPTSLVPSQSVKSNVIPRMPKGPTVEEIEQSLTTSITPNVIAGLPVCSLSASAISAAELEQKFLQECGRSRDPQTLNAKPSTSANQLLFPFCFPHGAQRRPNEFQSHPPNVSLPPVFPPMPAVLLQFTPIWMDFLTRRIQYLPPSIPPVHPLLILLLKQYNDPVVVMRIIQHHCSSVAPHFIQSQALSQPAIYNIHTHHKKAPGMPSGKTIEDLAFDQFAGFMSCKERQWLVRIQLMQCQGASNNPYNDDYYYECWRRKKLVEDSRQIKRKSENRADNKEQPQQPSNFSRRRRDRRESERNCSSESKDKDLVSRFAGSLGLPSKCTTSNPRHSIRVEASDDEQRQAIANTQRRLRTLLLRIESATNLLIECQDLVISLQCGTVGISRESVQFEIACRVRRIINDMFDEDLHRIVQIAKGRRLVEKLLRYANIAEHVSVLNSCFLLHVHQKKTSVIEWPEFSSNFIAVLSSYSRDQLISLTSGINTECLVAGLDESMLCREILAVLLLICCTKKATTANSLFLWLKTPVPRDSLKHSWASEFHKILVSLEISIENIQVLSEWLVLLADHSHATVASEISSAL